MLSDSTYMKDLEESNSEIQWWLQGLGERGRAELSVINNTARGMGAIA